jgi:hypothetical protein
MKAWLDECGRRHAECHINTMARAPTRLLDIGSEAENREPRLVLAGQRELTYAILSYCWGTLPVSDSSKSTRSNAVEHLNQIARDSLPRTIQDAIRVIRTLGLQYIWVDSVCIYPDRYRTKCCRNLRFEPQFSEGVGSAHLVCRFGHGAPLAA